MAVLWGPSAFPASLLMHVILLVARFSLSSFPTYPPTKHVVHVVHDFAEVVTLHTF